MASVRSVMLGAILSLAGAVAAKDPFSTCSSDLPLSCQNTTVIEDTCCFIPQGQLLLTTFWDYDPAVGPDDEWTIHGLWPDNCDSTYESNCDPSRQYTNISDILTSFGEDDTLTYMNSHWVDQDGDTEDFWEHEWSKHGTCVSTLDPSCYDDFNAGEEAAAYFAKVVTLHKAHPTYEWLAAANITPDESTEYELSKILSTLKAKHGAAVSVQCENGNLNGVWYHFNVQGSLQDGDFVAVASDDSQGECPDTVKYTPKSSS